MKKIVLITGASKGIGRAVAEYLSKKNYKVYGTSRSEMVDDDIEYIKLDVTNSDSVKQCIARIVEIEGRIDILVNNAGFGLVGSVLSCTVDDIQSQMEVNLFGIHRVIKECHPHMKNGYIINIGSFGGRLALPYQSMYSVSKAAIAMYTDGLRMELYTTGIKVSLIEPGDTKSDFDNGRKTSKYYNSEDLVGSRAINIMRVSEKKGAEPIVVGKTVYKIINSRNPKPRYLTGSDSKFFGFLQRIISHRFLELLIMKTYKLPR